VKKMITAEHVKELREKTGAPMMDCKQALQEAKGDFDRAVELLREKGIANAAKKMGREAKEGLIYSYIHGEGRIGVLVEVNCETDFVAKSDDFLEFSKAVAEAVAKHNPADVAALQNVTLSSGQSVKERLEELALKIGEKISVRRFTRYETTHDYVASYLHGMRIGVLVEMRGADRSVGTEIGMHVAAARPQYVKREQVDPAEVAREKEIYSEQLRAQNKPANIVENIVKGKLDKFYGEICLLEQPFIKDENLTVEKFLTDTKSGVERFTRYELGEGIVKVAKDFAAEVAEQLE